MKMVLIEWLDSSSYSSWHKLGNDDSITRCVSVGVLCKEDTDSVTVFLSKNDYGSIADTMSIPKVSIKRMRYLRVVK